RRKVLVSATACAISWHNDVTSTPVNRREVMPANFCNWRLSLASLSLADFKYSDLSSSKVRIIPRATKNLGVFQSSGLICRLGHLASTSTPTGNTAPHRKKPPALAITPGDHRR